MRDRQELYREIKDKNDIVSVISEYTTLKRSGRGLTGLCPFHSEKTPSFSVNPTKQFFYCFGCGKGGDVISFVMKAENLDFIGAAKRLAQRGGVAWPEYQPESEEERKKEKLYQITKLAAAFFQHCLVKTEQGEPGRRYLESRKINPESWSRFGLGYAPAGWHHLTELFKQKGIAVKEAESIGLVGFGENGYYDRFRERLMFPIYDLRGNIAGFGGRVIDGNHQPKYLNSPESVLFHKSYLMYGLYQAKEGIRRSGQVLIVEGFLDVVQAHQAGFNQAMASLGTALTREQVKIIKRYASEAILGYDGDNAGQNATRKGIELLQEANLDVKILQFPDGHDPDSLIRENGAAAFESVMQNRMNLVEYTIRHELQNVDLNSPEGKAQAVQKVLPHLATVESTIAREAYVRKITREVGVSETAIFNELRRWTRNNGKNSQGLDRINNNSYTKEIPVNSPVETAYSVPVNLTPLQKAIFDVEKELLQLTLQEYDKFERIKVELETKDFRFEIWRSLFAALDQKNSTSEGTGLVLEELVGASREIAATLLAEKEVKDQPADLSGILNRLKMLHLQEQIQSLTNQISTGRDAKGVVLQEAELRDKILEFTELKRRLQKEFPAFTAEIS